MSGYKVGPTIPAGEDPWPPGWEQDPRIDDGHAHDWECCLLQAVDEAGRRRRHRIEEVVRCSICHAPRCGPSSDDNPCMERRHHDGVHIHLDGSFDPLGGILP